MAHSERRPMAQHLVSQRHQLRCRSSDPRGALAPRPELLAGAPAHLGREREARRQSIPATSRPGGRPAASTPTGSPRRPGRATLSIPTGRSWPRSSTVSRRTSAAGRRSTTPTATACCWSTRTGGPAWSISRRSSPSRLQGVEGLQPAGAAGQPRARRPDAPTTTAMPWRSARIYRLLGTAREAQEFDDLAAKIAAAVRRKMWRPEKRFFYSLRADDDAVADVKEVIGVYPFYFGMVPWGRLRIGLGVDPRPETVLDELAGGLGVSGMPGLLADQLARRRPRRRLHVERADLAARQLACHDGHGADPPRHPRPRRRRLAAQERAPLGSSFISFTKAQYRDQDMRHPWTGEFYNGDTGQWKTAERDYNHSTWLDILIPELIGAGPARRRDPRDRSAPAGDALGYFILDGLRYHGHDVTIAWDAAGTGQPRSLWRRPQGARHLRGRQDGRQFPAPCAAAS